MATSANIIYVDGNGMLSSTYVHADGYPQHTGDILKSRYSEAEYAEQIANEGYISYLTDDGEVFITNAKDQNVGPERVQLDNLDDAVWKVSEIIANNDYAYFFSEANPKWQVLRVPMNGDIRRMELNMLLSDVLGVSHMGHEDDVNESYEVKWKSFLNEAFNKEQVKSLLGGKSYVDEYIESVTRDINLNGAETYSAFSKEDWITDYEDYVADKMDY